MRVCAILVCSMTGGGGSNDDDIFDGECDENGDFDPDE